MNTISKDGMNMLQGELDAMRRLARQYRQAGQHERARQELMKAIEFKTRYGLR